RRCAAVVRHRRLRLLRAQAPGAGLLWQPVHAGGQRRCGDATDCADVPPADRKPRRAIRRACGRPLRRRSDRKGTAGADDAPETDPMNIGIVCYASLGGSGVVATELAHALASRGHEVHLISSDEPFRWRAGVPRLSFERVETPAYPLFREP